MRAAAAFLAGLLVSSTALAEPHPVPPGVSAAWVVEGTARLRLDGNAEADKHLTLLPEGVYFTADGYKALTDTTVGLQRDVATLRASLQAYEATALAAPPVLPPAGWSGKAVLLVFMGGLALGASGFVLLGGGR